MVNNLYLMSALILVDVRQTIKRSVLDISFLSCTAEYFLLEGVFNRKHKLQTITWDENI